MAGAKLDTHVPLAYLRSGPFISGTTHALLRLGQRPQGGTDALTETQSIEDGLDLIKKADKSQQARRGRTGVALKDLLDNGIINPGRNNITVSYKGITYTASLQKDGLILHQGQKYNSATAFSIYCKRLQTPNKQGDDGWKSVMYEGTPLDVFRRKLQATGKPAEPTTSGAALEPAVEGEAGAEAAASTDTWVQCDRCRTWRVVPPESWPAVEADEREEWLCEYAFWDVAKPFLHDFPDDTESLRRAISA